MQASMWTNICVRIFGLRAYITASSASGPGPTNRRRLATSCCDISAAYVASIFRTFSNTAGRVDSLGAGAGKARTAAATRGGGGTWGAGGLQNLRIAKIGYHAIPESNKEHTMQYTQAHVCKNVM